MNLRTPSIIAVLGAGTMGHGIAQIAAMAGHRVLVQDPQEGAAQHGLHQIQRNLAKGVERGKVLPQVQNDTLENLAVADSLEQAIGEAEVVIEAAPEDLDLKQALFREISKHAPPQAILGTNTSSLPVSRIAEAATHPDRVIGMHFFNPVHLMPLLEIVRGDQTSEQTVATVQALGVQMGKTCIVVRDAPGFATSRLGVVIGLEAIRMLEQGVASAEDIDTAMTLGYKHPVGPLRLTDMVGLDVRLAIAKHLHKTLQSEAFNPPKLLQDKVDRGELGKKTGLGFYSWE